MRSKTTKIKLILSLIITSILLFTLSGSALAKEGTDGSELQIATPEQLEIQLGTAWAGVEFHLKTDYGMYPGTIQVGDDGVLRLEIGGSSSYQLTCLGSGTAVPTPEPTLTVEPTADPMPSPVPTVNEDTSEIAEAGESQPQVTINVTEVQSEPPVDIPVWQIALFGSGLTAAVGVLIVLMC